MLFTIAIDLEYVVNLHELACDINVTQKVR